MLWQPAAPCSPTPGRCIPRNSAVGTSAAAAGGGVLLVVILVVVAALAVPTFVRYRVGIPTA